MDWIQEARRLFTVPKPVLFTNYRHCCECAEHDETLLTADIDSIDLQQLGNPGWDPLCFTSAESLLSYMPALIRLTLETMATPQERYHNLEHAALGCYNAARRLQTHARQDWITRYPGKYSVHHSKDRFR
jgi:hypothetical protein